MVTNRYVLGKMKELVDGKKGSEISLYTAGRDFDVLGAERDRGLESGRSVRGLGVLGTGVVKMTRLTVLQIAWVAVIMVVALLQIA